MSQATKNALRRPQSSYNIKKNVVGLRPASSNKKLTNLQSQYMNFTSEKQHEEETEEKYQRLRRIYNEGARKMKNYQVQDALNLFKSYIQKLASELGTDSAQFQRDFPSLMQTVCNYSIRMQQETNNHELPLMILLWAEDITNPLYQFEDPLSSRCLVYNNLGCVYRRTGKLQHALNCMEQALSLVQADERIPHQTITYLNITAILSQMGLHERALEFAQQSYQASSQDLSAFLRDESRKDDDAAYQQKLKYVAISMHNVGIEEECCGQLESAIGWYIKSTEYIEKHFGQDEPLFGKFNGSLVKAKRKQSSMLKESSQKLKASLLPLRKSQTMVKVGKMSLLQNKTVKNLYREEQKEEEKLEQSRTVKQLQVKQQLKQQVNAGQKDEKKEIVELKTLGVLDWSEDEEKEGKEKGESDGESVQAVMEQEEKEVGARKEFVGEEMQRDERVQFLERMTLYEIEKAKRHEEEQKDDADQDELVENMDQEQELDELKIIKIQSYIRMKLQQKVYKRQLEETKKRKKAEEYELKIRRLQKWFKYMLFQMRMKKLTRELVRVEKCKRFPDKEFAAAVSIQKHIKRFLQYTQQQNIKALKKEKGFHIIKTFQMEPVFWDDEKRILHQKQLYNKLFLFRMSISKPHKLIKVAIAPYEKRKCLKQFRDGFQLTFSKDDFYKTLILLPQYIEELRCAIDEDTQVTATVQQVYVYGTYFLKGKNLDLNNIAYELIFKEESLIEEYLSKIASLLKYLVRIQENKTFILMGFNDFKYHQQIIEKEKEVQVVKKPPIQYSHGVNHLALIIKVQNKIKAFILRARMKLMMQRKNILLKIFTVKHGHEFIRVSLMQDRKTLRRFVCCRVESKKKRTNQKEISAAVTRQLGLPTPDNFFEIYSIHEEGGKCVLDFSDEGLYWINKEREDQKGKKRVTLKVFNAMATRIQNAIRRYLFLEYVRLRLHNQKKQAAPTDSNVHRVSLVKKVSIQGEKRAYYLNFFLINEKHQVEDLNCLSFLKPDKSTEYEMKQSIEITTKPLEHSYSRDIIQSFKQQLFYYIDQNEMIGIAYKMLEIAKVVKGKQTMYKLEVKNLEEVQGIIINEQNKHSGIVSQKDETLEARKIFNVQTLRKKYFSKNDNINLMIEYPQEKMVFRTSRGALRMLGHLQMNDNYFKVIKNGFQTYEKKQHDCLKNLKNVKSYDQENISDYIRQYPIASEYGYGLDDPRAGMEALDFLELLRKKEQYDIEEKQRVQREEEERQIRLAELEKEKQKRLIDAQEFLYSDYCVISTFRIYLKVIYNTILDQIFIIASQDQMQSSKSESAIMMQQSRVSDGNDLTLHLDRKQLLPGGDVDIAYMKSHVEQLIIKQLKMEEDAIYYDPDQVLQLQLLQEQIIWIDEQNNPNEVSFISGQTYGYQQLFHQGINITKSTYENLKEFNKQLIRMAIFQIEETFENEYLFNLSDNEFIITIYYLNDVKIRKMYIVPASDFECPYLINLIKQATPEKIIAFMSQTLQAIESLLIIQLGRNVSGKKVVETNFNTFRPFLATIFKEQFLIKLQNIIRVKKIKEQYSIYLSAKRNSNKKTYNKRIFLFRNILNFEGRYIGLRFYLIKNFYELRFYLEELNTIDGNGNIITKSKEKSFHYFVYKISLLELQERSTLERLINSLNQDEKDYFLRVDPEKWLELQNVHPPEYYRNIFAPLIRLICESLKITFPSSQSIKIFFENHMHLPMVQEKYVTREELKKRMKTAEETHETPFYQLIKAALKLQKSFKRLRQQEWFLLKQEAKLQLEIKSRKIGYFIKRAIRYIEEKLYIINIYKRFDTNTNQKILTFDLIPYTDSKIDRRNIKKRARGFYVLDPKIMLNIGAQQLYDYLIDQIYFDAGILKFRESDFHKYQPQSAFSDVSTTQSSTKPPLEKQESTLQMLEEMSKPEKLVYHTHQQLHNDEDNRRIPETLYNVIYTGNRRLKAIRHESLMDNTVQLEVNLANVSKLYPTLNTEDADLMKVIGQQLIEGIKINDQGHLLVDEKKINPNFITINENKISQGEFESLQKNDLNNKQAFVKILVKKTTYYDQMKYLIIINFIERKITKILKDAVDQVFEEYEVLYQIVASNLSNKLEPPIVWELSPQEAQILSHMTDKKDIAHSLVKRILVINQKFIFLTKNKEDMQQLKNHPQNVILFLEKGIRPIQNKFRNRQFSKNYKLFREQLAQWKDNQGYLLPTVALYSLQSLRSVYQFVALCGEDRSRHIMFYAWNMQNFKKYEIEIPKQKSKKEAIVALCQFIQYNMDEDVLNFTSPKFEQLTEEFTKQLKQSQRQTMR